MGKRVALIRGDGTGPELVDAMLTVMKATGTDTEFIQCEAGLEWWERNGGPSLIPDETWRILDETNACFKGTICSQTSDQLRPFRDIILPWGMSILFASEKQLKECIAVSTLGSAKTPPLEYAR